MNTTLATMDDGSVSAKMFNICDHNCAV